MKKNKVLIISGVFFVAFIVTYIYLLCNVLTYEDGVIKKNSDVIIVLGYTLDEGLYPSTFLEKRMETALNLYNDGYGKNIIVSGGRGPRDNIAVGEVMYNWFLEKGVTEENLFLENGARNTYENFAYSKKICIDNDFNSVIVVSNDFHMYRSLIMGKEFFNEIYGKESKVSMDLEKFMGVLKEPLSIYKYFLFDKNSIKVEKNLQIGQNINFAYL